MPQAQQLLTPVNGQTKIVLAEGDDPRVRLGAINAAKKGIANIILLGDDELISNETAEYENIRVINPQTASNKAELAESLYELRKHKGLSLEKANELVGNPLTFGALLVKTGEADGMVAGAVNTTSDVVRAALQIVGKAPTSNLVSSFFLMLPPENSQEPQRPMVFADCGLIIDPSALELSEIAYASALSLQSLLFIDPKIAFLSFSSMGSAKHSHVEKISNATKQFKADYPNIPADGELQFDAAFIPEIGAQKAPSSQIAGHANVMVFPNLDAGNIGYKIAQRLGGYRAIGPILQGLTRPVNDLSRGCDAEDVEMMIAITARQAN